MAPELRHALLVALLERVRLDPRLRGLVSEVEAEALEGLLGESPAPPEAVEPEPPPLASRPEPLSTPPGVESPSAGDLTVAIPGPRAWTRLALDAVGVSPRRDVTLCLDMGTATSKVGATRHGREPLALRIDPGACDDAGLIVDSTSYVTREGRLLFGAPARSASLRDRRPRLDSLKAVLCRLPLDQDLDATPVGRGGEGMSLGQALRFQLAWLTHRAHRAAETQHGLTGPLLRRFAVPCWPSARARVLEPLLAGMIAEAILVADTLGDALDEGLPWTDLARMFELAGEADRPTALVGRAVPEPIAAAASRFGPESRSRGLVLVVDVGAGTTDLALFVLDVDPEGPRFEIRPIEGGTDLVARAGDAVDRALVEIACASLSPGLGPASPSRRRRRLELEARAWKEQVLRTGEALIDAGDGARAVVARGALLDHPDVAGLEPLLRRRIRALLGRLPESRARALASEGLTVCLAGGGAYLPSVAALARGATEAHGVVLEHRPGPELPRFVADVPELRAAYPRLAVALGGASGYLPGEGARFARARASAERVGRAHGPGSQMTGGDRGAAADRATSPARAVETSPEP